jgi:hypothetical protein
MSNAGIDKLSDACGTIKGLASLGSEQLKTFDFTDHVEGIKRDDYIEFLKNFCFACAGYGGEDKSITTDPVSNHGLELAFALNAIYQLIESYKRHYNDKNAFNEMIDTTFTIRGARLHFTDDGIKIPYIPYAFLLIANLREVFQSKDFRVRTTQDLKHKDWESKPDKEKEDLLKEKEEKDKEEALKLKKDKEDAEALAKVAPEVPKAPVTGSSKKK